MVTLQRIQVDDQHNGSRDEAAGPARAQAAHGSRDLCRFVIPLRCDCLSLPDGDPAGPDLGLTRLLFETL